MLLLADPRKSEGLPMTDSFFDSVSRYFLLKNACPHSLNDLEYLSRGFRHLSLHFLALWMGVLKFNHLIFSI
jgi:hypothetical protein